MKIVKTSFVCMSLLAAIFILPAYAEKKIAVLPFNIPNEQPEIKQFSYGTMAVLNHTLNTFPDYTVIDRGQIESILKEIGFQKSAFTDESTSIKIGKISGVDILVLGTIQVSNNTYRVNVNVTDVKTGKIIKTLQVTGSEMFQLQDQLAEQLLSLSTNKEVLIAKKASPEAYNLYIQAKENLNNLNIELIQGSIDLFDKSLAIDNKYTSAIYGKLKAQSMIAYLMKEEGKNYSDLLATIKETINKIPDSDKENIDYNFARYFLYKTEANSNGEKETSDKLIKIAKNEYVSIITNLGKYYNSNNKHEQSENILREAIKVDPTYIYSYFNLAVNFGYQNKEEEEIELYDKILKINPNFVVALVNKGGVYLGLGKYDLAQQLYEEALKIEPNSASAHFSLGQIYLLQKKTDLALEEFQKAVSLNNKFSYAYDKIAYIYQNQKKYPEALEYYNKALDLSRDKSYIYQGIADLYVAQSNYDMAMINYKKALEVNPKDPFVHASLGSTYKDLDKIDLAITEYKDAIKYAKEQNSDSLAFLYSGLGSVYEKVKRFDEALEAYIEGQKFDIKDELLYISIGNVYQYKNNYSQAIDTYNQLLKINPNSSHAYYGIAESYYEQKDHLQTLKYLDIIGKMEYSQYIKGQMGKLTFNTYMNMGIAAYGSGKTDEAIEHYIKALNVKPDVSIYNNLGAAYYTKGKYQEAMTQYKKALELKPDHADSHNNLGLTYQVLGYALESEAEYKKACDLGLKSSCK